MKKDSAQFFQEAVIRITSTLDVDVALSRCFDFLIQHIPAQASYLTMFDEDSGILSVIAEATDSGGRIMDLKIPFGKQARAAAARGTLPDALIINNAATHPLTYNTADYMKSGPYSVLLMGLVLEGRRLGGLSLWAKGENKYSQKDLDLLMLLQKPVAVALANSLKHRELIELKGILADDNLYLKQELNLCVNRRIIGADFGLKPVMEHVHRVSPLASPVILLGETGVGKSLIAGAIHAGSPRRNGPFVSVNCGAIPETLIDSELFGHERGAFTGAVDKTRGRFERAHHGTIFLDEIGELPMEAQVRLLKVIEDKQIARLGESRDIALDIRIIAATHRNLEAMVCQGQFRQDLYFRLMVFPIFIPPLRERKVDIPALADAILRKKAGEMGLSRPPVLAAGAMDRLIAHDWPGNVRDLENAIERALILSREGPLDFSELSDYSSKRGEQVASSTPQFVPEVSLKLDSVIADHILRVLEITDGKVAGKNSASQILGLHPATLRHRMRKLGIPFGRKAATS